MKKAFKLITAILLFAISAHAQPFFKPLPKLQPPAQKKSFTFPSTVTATDSTYGAIRPIYIAAAYSLPDNHLMAGAGIGYQNVTYNYATGRSYCNYSISAVGFAGGAIAPINPGQVVSYGLMVGALNNSIMAGAALNNGKVNFVLSYGINFNN